MTLTLNLNPQTEADLLDIAKRTGADVSSIVEQLLAQHLPTFASHLENSRISHQVYDQPVTSETSALQLLVARWDDDDDPMTDAEMEAEERLCDSFEQGLQKQPYAA